MAYRKKALWRLAAFIWMMTVGWLVLIVISTVALVWGLIDVVWQLVVGTNGLSASSRPAMIVKDTYQWQADQMSFATTGDGEFAALP